MKFQTSGKNSVRIGKHNRRLVLDVIRAREPVSRPEIAKLTGLTTATITNVVGKLQNDGLIEEAGLGQSAGGRKPGLLQLARNSRLAIAVDLAATDLMVALTNVKGEILRRTKREIVTDSGLMVPRMIEAIKEVMSCPGVGRAKIAGIGVTTPGLVDQTTGTIIKSVRLDWYHVPIKAILQNHFEVPVFVGKDTHAAILGEQWYGAGKNADSLIYVWVGAGIAIGILLDGRIYTGATGMAGEFGHTSIQCNGARCKCGNEGCLEGLASLEAVAMRAGEALNHSDPGRNWAQAEAGFLEATIAGTTGREVQQELAEPGEVVTGERPMAKPLLRVDPVAVLEAACAGDPLACEVVDEAGRYLGVGIANLINLFNPERIIIGGQIRPRDERFVAASIEVAKKRALPEIGSTVRITVSEFGQDAGLMGATALVWREVLEDL